MILSIMNLLSEYQKKTDLPMKDLINAISKDKGISKRDVYQQSLKWEKKKLNTTTGG